jgi:hypothetical protein
MQQKGHEEAGQHNGNQEAVEEVDLDWEIE